MSSMITAPSAEAQEQYDELAKRLGELRAEFGAVSGEFSAIMSMAGIGQLVGTGQPYEKQLARAAQMRLQIEALEFGIQYVEGQIALLLRSNYNLNRRLR